MSPHLRPSLRQLLTALVYLAVSVPALVLGFGFGLKLAGWPMGLLTAINTWLITVLLVGSLMQALRRLGSGRRPPRADSRP
jgi:RsiW-degrading membrane proteinase PrsW (M82 family)